MAMMTDIQAYENVQKRSRPELRTGYALHSRVYENVPAGWIASLPDKGAAVTVDGLTGSGLMQPRVYGAPISRLTQQHGWEVAMTFYQLRPYGGTAPASGDTGVELEGSRQTQEDFRQKTATRLFACSADDYSGLPSVASASDYVGDSGASARRCVALRRDDQSLPGLILYSAQYSAQKELT